ncbi:MAG: ArsR family transcriptional regulator [Microbacterium sp.]|nr:ArsR family transcriptional regulator [Microbacterium sp.]
MVTRLPLLTSPDAAVCGNPLVREPMSATDADTLAALLKALADPARLRLLSIVASSADHEACVCDLTEPVGLTQPTVSHHLKVLTTAGFLSRTQRGTWAYYRLVPGALSRIAGMLDADA